MFRDLLLGLFTPAALSDYLGDTSARTVQRWHATNTAPMAVILLLRLLRGELGLICPAWTGWTLGRDGRLYDCHGNAFSPGDVLSLIYQRQLTRALQVEVKRLRDDADHQRRMFTAANDAAI